MRIFTAFAALVVLIGLAQPARAQNPPTTATRIVRGFGAPAAATCATSAEVSKVYVRLDSASVASPLYICTNTAVGTYAWVLSYTGGVGTGTVTSVGQSFTGGLISVAGSPITTTGTLALTVAGTSGGIPYFSSASTWASSGALTANLPVFGGGAGTAPFVGTRSGNTTAVVTTTGAQTSGRCVEIDASGNHIASAAGCASGTGTVTSIGTTGPIGGGTITTTGTITCTTCTTNASALTANLPVIGGGSNAVAVGTRSGNTTAFATVTGSFTSGNCVKTDANGNFVDNGGACGSGGTGTVTVVGAGNLTSTALVTGGGSQTIQTPAATATMDSSGNISTPGTMSTGVGGSVGGAVGLGQGTATTAATGIAGFMAPASVTTPYYMILPAAPTTGFLLNTGTTDPSTISIVGSSGSGNVCRVTSCTMVTPTLGVATATSYNGLTITGTTGTFTLTNGKTFSVAKSITLDGTDSTTMTFPTTSATIARTDAANTFTGTQTIGALVATTVNGNTFTTGTGVLTIAASKTLTASNSITLAGTDSTTMTFPSVSSTITRTVASGAKSLATSAISSAACTSAQTDTATGTATTDTIQATFNGDPTAVTGFVPLTTGMLTIIVYPTADTVNIKVCNNTSSSITPGAITINWRVVR